MNRVPRVPDSVDRFLAARRPSADLAMESMRDALAAFATADRADRLAIRRAREEIASGVRPRPAFPELDAALRTARRPPAS